MSNDGKIGEFTPEKIDFDKMNEVVKICFCEALAEYEDGGRRSYPPDFFRSLEGYDVLFVVNGVQLSFESIVRLFDKQYDEQVTRAARQLAEERVALSPVVDRLHRLSYEISEELDRLFPGTKSDSRF